MRRCLRAFLVGLITLSLLSGPAHACWRSRQARHCRPVVVVACPPSAPPAWSACCDPCGDSIVVVERTCPPAPACCGAGEFVVEEHVVADGLVAGLAGESVDGTVIEPPAAPQPAAASRPLVVSEPESKVVTAEPRAAGLEPVAPPPALAPAGEAGGVQTTSIEEPVTAPTAEPAAESVLAAEPEPKQSAAGEAAAPAVEPAEPVPPSAPLAAADEAAAPSADEPEMKEDEPLPGTEPVSPAGPPTEEDADAPEPAPPARPEPVVPETVPPAPAEPAPEADNIFEELDAEGGEAAPAGDEKEMADEPAADAGEPETESSGEPAADASGDKPAAEPEMVEDDPAAADAGREEPADPFAEDDAAPAADSEPAADPEPAEEPADSSANSEPVRRWIDATGTASLVARLIEVGADGRCVLETSGRRIAVPVENLSGHDRGYVREAGVRLAKLRMDRAGETAAAAPAPTDTAGL